jgi:nicotinamidase-related amidase
MRMLKTTYEEIVSVQEIGQEANSRKLNDLLKLANGEQLTPSVKDPQQVLLLAIDMQNDFMEKGSLPVPGSHGDVERSTRFIYNNMDKISRIAVSLDTHQPFQIFHPCWFVDKNGNNPPPYTMISVKDLDDGIWFPVIRPKETREYIEGLSSTPGKKVLMIWTYHCIQGTYGAALENQFSKMVYFHSVAKKSITERLVKGTDPMTEMYGIIKPEFDPKNFINIDFLNKLEKYDKVVIVGEAKSHCVLESVKQVLEYFANRPEITSKVYILEDCMNSIPGCEDQTNQTFADFKKKYHVNIVKSTDNIL